MASEYLVIKDLEFEIKQSDENQKVWVALHKGKAVATAFNKVALKDRILLNSKFWASSGPKKHKSQFFS